MDEDVALGDEEGEVFLDLQLTNGLVDLVRQDLRYHRLLDVVLTACHQGYAHPVAIEGKHRVALRDEDGRAAIVGQESILAVGLAQERALLHLSLLVQAIFVVADLQ